MNLDEFTMSTIKDCIESSTEKEKEDAICDYLEGSGLMKIPTDPRNRDSLHAYGYAIMMYNKYFQEHPESNLDKLFTKSILGRLKSDKWHSMFDCSRIYCAISTQLRLQQDGNSTFNLDENDLYEITDLLTQLIKEKEDLLKKYNIEEGEGYNQGIYEYMAQDNAKLEQQTGRKLIEIDFDFLNKDNNN